MQEVYLDNSATTRVDPRVARVALELMEQEYGNPSSLHKKGLSAQLRLDKAREQLAGALDCRAEEIVFTAGGTEANNLALLGAARALRRRGSTLVATAFEHSSVLEPLRQLEREGFTLKWIYPGPAGEIDPAAVADAVDGNTVLVSCMLVNSEVGSIQPLEQIVRLVRRKSSLALVHSDGVQALGKLPFSVKKLGVDLLTVSGHKIHGPKGCGALVVKKGVRLQPVLFGGGQEGSRRPGTESTPLACAFGEAAALAQERREESAAHVRALCEYFLNIAKTLPGVCINSPAGATPYICSLSVPGYRSEILLHHLEARGVYVSSGSACSKGAASHVLQAMGLPRDRVDSALRVSFCRGSTREDVDAFFAALRQGMDTLLRQ